MLLTIRTINSGNFPNCINEVVGRFSCFRGLIKLVGKKSAIGLLAACLPNKFYIYSGLKNVDEFISIDFQLPLTCP